MEMKGMEELHASSKKRKKVEGYVVAHTEEELLERGKLFGSSLSVMDRMKFEKEFDVNQLKLSKEDRIVYDLNPHIRQSFLYGRFARDRIPSLEHCHRVLLHGSSPRKSYVRRLHEAKTVEHWGQRKLLLSEIEFLTRYSSRGEPRLVVYAGAAPGTHIDLLHCVLFPELRFILVDPSHFEACPNDGVEIRNEVFDDEMAREFVGKDVLFISDIRGNARDGHSSFEAQVSSDMMQQKRWCEIMKPRASMLKFRLPYADGTTSYLDGELMLPVWGGRTTTETRLVVPGSAIGNVKVYDHRTYWEEMFYHNTIRRTMYYEHCVVAEGIDHCYDCAAEVSILANYIRKNEEFNDEEQLWELVGDLSTVISEFTSNIGRSLCLEKMMK
eukprot:TRINITY_DN1136_c0_g1_i1.p2 TRINITY_DN1136_c0_g1~~TRINITY_DN1136_c0_g1_i1.p2  ORF type:complete len:413 (-),score=120.13 TRINITY_DN1136_c0_g1_i1:1478-2629(-)